MKTTIIIGICILLIGCSKEPIIEYIPIDEVTEVDCSLIQIWNESKSCISDYCYKDCWEPYDLGSVLFSLDEMRYDFNNNSKIDGQERFILDQNLKSANECIDDCFKTPYGCFDYVMDIRCETDYAVDKINTTSGEIVEWKS